MDHRPTPYRTTWTPTDSVAAWIDAARDWQRLGRAADAARCTRRAVAVAREHGLDLASLDTGQAVR